jgi:hypothetical protein
MSNRGELLGVEKPAKGLPWKPIAAVLICALAVTAVLLVRPWAKRGEPGEENQTPGGRPEGYVAFRFKSSFTYVSSPTDERITDVELRLPWPYIDARENGRPAPKPVGLDNWLYKAPLSVSLVGLDPPKIRWLWEVWKLEDVSEKSLEEIENLAAKLGAENDPSKLENLIRELNIFVGENVVWTVELDLPGLPYTEVSFKPSLKLYYGDKLEWQDNQIVELLGNRTAAPTITAYFERWSSDVVFQKVAIKVSDMQPNETMVIEGTFLVAEENASKVRLDDYIESGIWRTLKPKQENAPSVDVYWSGPTTTTSVISQLEKLINGKFTLIVKYEEIAEDLSAGSHGGLIDDKITQ